MFRIFTTGWMSDRTTVTNVAPPTRRRFWRLPCIMDARDDKDTCVKKCGQSPGQTGFCPEMSSSIRPTRPGMWGMWRRLRGFACGAHRPQRHPDLHAVVASLEQGRSVWRINQALEAIINENKSYRSLYHRQFYSLTFLSTGIWRERFTTTSTPALAPKPPTAICHMGTARRSWWNLAQRSSTTKLCNLRFKRRQPRQRGCRVESTPEIRRIFAGWALTVATGCISGRIILAEPMFTLSRSSKKGWLMSAS